MLEQEAKAKPFYSVVNIPDVESQNQVFGPESPGRSSKLSLFVRAQGVKMDPK